MREPFRLLRLHRFLHEDQIRDKLGVVTRVLQDSRHLNACVLVHEKLRLAPGPQVWFATVFISRTEIRGNFP